MRWILANSTDIAVNNNQIQARRKYIQRVTGVEVTDWDFMRVDGKICKNFLSCTSNDKINGSFITAHIGDVVLLCSLREIFEGKLVVANTCIWHKGIDKEILKNMRRFNRDVELWFAEQELFLDCNQTLRQSTELKYIGQFGFHTSPSERELFKNRNKGLDTAIRESFVRVSPVILGE